MQNTYDMKELECLECGHRWPIPTLFDVMRKAQCPKCNTFTEAIIIYDDDNEARRITQLEHIINYLRNK